MNHYLTFGDINSADYGIFMAGGGSFNTPERAYQEITVPGRNGNLAIDDGRFENVTVTYHAIIMRSFPSDYEGFRNAFLSLRGYQRLEDTIHPDEYRMALYKGGIEPEIKGLQYEDGKFDIVFSCKPQRYLKSGEEPVEFNSSGMIYNETLFETRPLIRVYGNGVLGVGGETLTIAGVSGYVDIDCEIEDAYQGTANLNNNITLSSGEFPRLKNGENGISVGAGITRVVITPRWWII